MSMTVNEMIQHLKDLRDEGHGDKEVMFSYNYGDYWKTSVAARVDAAEPMEVVYSDYHQMHKLVEYDAEAEPSERRTDTKEVIVIS
jgi:hypothetical protein